MARLPRLTLAGYPHHVIQRGNNRQPIFTCAADYHMLLNLLDENAKKFAVAVHAYVLMGNHFHLLATPQTADGLPQMMQAVGRAVMYAISTTVKSVPAPCGKVVTNPR
jgi:putative transposase